MGITKTTAWIILLHLSYTFGHGYDTGDFDSWYQPVPHRPVDIITDVVNDLGVRILQQYTAHGNVAFSPMGVSFILTALYEGSSTRSSHQISESLGLPRDRDITRIGFRDINQRLRTYLDADGFLGGLTLNQENTRLRPEYEDVLRFYGFDLSMNDESNNTTSAPEITKPGEVTEESVTGSDAASDAASDPPGTTPPSTTAQLTEADDSTSEVTSNSPTSPVEMLDVTPSTVNLQDRLTQSTDSPSSTDSADTTVTGQTMPEARTAPTEQTNVSGTELPGESSVPTTSPSISMGTSATIAADITTPSTTSAVVETTTENGSPMNSNDENMLSTSEASEPSTVGTTGSSPEMEEVSAGSTTVSMMTIGEPEGVTSTGETSSVSAAAIDSAEVTTSLIDNPMSSSSGPPEEENTVSTDPAANETISDTSTGEMGSSDLPSTMAMIGAAATSTESSQGETTLSPSATDESMNRVRRRSPRSPRGYFSSYPDEGIWMQDLGIWKPFVPTLSEASVRDSTEITFLVNGCDVSSISATTYIAVLPFAYFPSLHAVALEFPLDDPRYNILLMMSTNRRDTYRLARDLGGKSLRLLRKQLQPTWVRATIPSFMLRGFVTLTPFLQRLGIVDVFEPRAADLSPMTPDRGVYVRDVQQSIGVNIRNYMKPDRTHSRNGLFERAGPVPFTAVHPFLYFIVDTETSVALIAGRVNDPLNSRIL